MKAVIIGAGRVACGFLAPLLSASGYEVILVGRRPEVVSALNRGSYLMDICHSDGSTSVVRVDGIRAISLSDIGGLDRALAGSRLVFTAAGAPALGCVTGPLANALLRNLAAIPPEGLDIISCENMPNAVALSRQWLADVSSPDERLAIEANVRFRRGMVWRIVSERRLSPDGLRLRGDDIERMDIEAPRGSPALPPIVGAVPRTRMAEAIHEKLHLFNSGHAVAGYLGYRYGFEFIHNALHDCFIAETVDRALQEASSWPPSLDADHDISQFVHSCLVRYANPALRDRTTRVAARPLQKLGPFERLVLPAWGTLTFGRTPVALAEAIAAALKFDCSQDAEASRLQRRICEVGVEQALEEVSGLRATDELMQLVLARVAAQRARSTGSIPTDIPRAAAR